MQNHITEIINNGEDQQSEFKPNFSKELIETVGAFSNSRGGKILVGVNDSGQITGVNANEEIIKDWMNNIKLDTQPQLFPSMNLIDVDNKTVVEISVPEYPLKPVSYKGRYYNRTGASNHLVPLNEIVEMQLNSLNSSFDSFPVSESIDDLLPDVIVSYFREVKNRGRIELSDNNRLNLEKTGFIRKGKISFAALLMFGEHHMGIHIGRFKTPDVIIDDILIKSPLVNAINDAMSFIKKNISVAFEFTNDTRRVEKWQYPLPVIRELLLNAVIHKDYRNPTDIIIKIYDHKIEITNPGSLMGGLTPEDLQTDHYIAVHRNKLLAEAFYLRGDVEKYGTGFIRIREFLRDCPEVTLDVNPQGDFIRTILADKKLTPHDTPQVEKLIAVMLGSMKRDELQNKLELADREYFRKYYLIPALNSGLIEMTIPGKPKSKNQKYRLTDSGKLILEMNRNSG
ncbi:putative DNA binding domain-containing protein [bacterium]|nr:putative DNA binding domain-containing protein [bacterium]MBU1065987.1 putative DNA binding domain-containing protein [bacterium]MBU1633350.1 putative DNA binding domain-containing protein [bacterium]MBU1872995.1 putative DNA binding domain-containing protein [bacterium]